MSIEEELRIHRELAVLLMNQALKAAVERRAKLNQAIALSHTAIGSGVWIPTIKGMTIRLTV